MEILIIGPLILFIISIIGIFISLKEEPCIKNKTHDWYFNYNSKGRTGDLGFGIRGSWNINYYKCRNCGKEKEEEIY